MATGLTNLIHYNRKWQVVPVCQQKTGDIGTMCGSKHNHGYNHIYLVLENTDGDKMLIAGNQEP